MRYRLAVLTGCVLTLSFAVQAHAFIFVNIPGIPGDATVADHEGEIEVLSLDFSGGQIVPKAGPKVCAAPSSKTQISAITLQKLADVASPKLFMAAAQGTIFPEVTITIVIVVSGDILQNVAQYELKNAFVSNYHVDSSGDRPSEAVSLTFKSLALTNFVPTLETATWDFCGVGH